MHTHSPAKIFGMPPTKPITSIRPPHWKIADRLLLPTEQLKYNHLPVYATILGIRTGAWRT